MTDTKMVLVSKEALELVMGAACAERDNLRSLSGKESITKSRKYFSESQDLNKALEVCHQGKVTPEMVEDIAMKLSPFSFSDDSHVSDARDKATRDYEKGIGRKAARSTVLKVIKALGLEVVIDD